jgi:ABC-type branched-subunit amino acid transport system ATPase component
MTATDPGLPLDATPADDQPLLVATNVTKTFEGLVANRDIDFQIPRHSIVAIIGPNGAGKSTLLKVVYGLLRPRAGTIRYAGDSVTGLPAEQLTRLGLNYVPQVRNVFPSLSVAENLQVACVSLPRAERRPALNELYAHFPLLKERRRQRAGTLSGGQRKLLAIARALATRPRALLLDEPSAGLSPQAVELVFTQLAGINARGIAIVMVEQNARRALTLADRGYVLDMGRNAYEGAGHALLHDPKVAELYLGGSRMASRSGVTGER